MVGKTDSGYLTEGIRIYTERLNHYIKFEMVEIQLPKSSKKMESATLKEAEGKMLLKYMQEADRVILLDEKGNSHTSESFALWLQKTMNSGCRHLLFIVGGAFGFSPDVYLAAHGKLALSEMTFSHQMVRLFFTEQLYRAFTILKNEPYHNA